MNRWLISLTLVLPVKVVNLLNIKWFRYHVLYTGAIEENKMPEVRQVDRAAFIVAIRVCKKIWAFLCWADTLNTIMQSVHSIETSKQKPTLLVFKSKQFSLKSTLYYVFPLPYSTLLDLILLLPVETCPSARKQHTNMSCQHGHRTVRLKLSSPSCRLATT